MNLSPVAEANTQCAIDLANLFLSKQKKAFSLHSYLLNIMGGFFGFSMVCDMVEGGMPLDTIQVFKVNGSINFAIDEHKNFIRAYMLEKLDLTDETSIEWLRELSSDHMTAEQVDLAFKGVLDQYEENDDLRVELRANELSNSPTYNGLLPHIALAHMVLMQAITDAMMIVNLNHKDALYK